MFERAIQSDLAQSTIKQMGRQKQKEPAYAGAPAEEPGGHLPDASGTGGTLSLLRPPLLGTGGAP